jgi:hypothetical protein
MLDFPALTAQLLWVSRQRSKKPPRLVSAQPRRDTPPFFCFTKAGGEMPFVPCLVCSLGTAEIVPMK